MFSCGRHLAPLLWFTLSIVWAGPAAGDGPDAEPQDGKLSLMTLLPDLTPVSDYEGDLWTRPVLFGDLAGHRQALYERGVALDFGLTQVLGNHAAAELGLGVDTDQSATPDLQYIQSGLPGVDNSVVLAMRIQMYF